MKVQCPYTTPTANRVITQQTTTNWYVHGLDLSGTLSGAGGIGGLLSAKYGTNDVAFTYDGNGNVSELIASAGGIAAHYEYSPFGETLVSTGPLAKENKFRFSTKPFDDDTGLSLYEYRAYGPSIGRWLSRDPMEELATLISIAGQNLDCRNGNCRQAQRGLSTAVIMLRLIARLTTYGQLHQQYLFARNDPIATVDHLGLQASATPPDDTTPGNPISPLFPYPISSGERGRIWTIDKTNK